MRVPGLAGAAMIGGAMISLALPAQGQSAAGDAPWVKVSVAETGGPVLTLSASPGSYVVVLRVSADRKVHVVFPASPTAQRPFPDGPGSYQILLDVPAYSMGGIYAAASDVPFNLTRIASGNRWNDDALILQSSRDAQHAANRVLGMITPLSATVAASEAVYLGRETAKHPSLFANAASLYLPVSFSYASDDQCSRIVGRYECGGDPTWRGSPYLGCLTLNSVNTPPYLFCGTVHDLFTYMAGTYPPREAVPFGGNVSSCSGRGEVCAPNVGLPNILPQWHPSADYSRPTSTPAPTPASPTPLPAPTSPPTNPLTIPPAY